MYIHNLPEQKKIEINDIQNETKCLTSKENIENTKKEEVTQYNINEEEHRAKGLVKVY